MPGRPTPALIDLGDGRGQPGAGAARGGDEPTVVSEQPPFAAGAAAAPDRHKR